MHASLSASASFRAPLQRPAPSNPPLEHSSCRARSNSCRSTGDRMLNTGDRILNVATPSEPPPTCLLLQNGAPGRRGSVVVRTFRATVGPILACESTYIHTVFDYCTRQRCPVRARPVLWAGLATRRRRRPRSPHPAPPLRPLWPSPLERASIGHP